MNPYKSLTLMEIAEIINNQLESANQAKILSCKLHSAEQNLDRISNQILRDMPVELREQMLELQANSQKNAENAFVKELTKRDNRYRLDEFSLSDLWGDETPGIYPGT